MTPYQGQKECFGYYHCNDCNKEWHSAHSWANTEQYCSQCYIGIYPYKQHKLKKTKGKITKNKQHIQHLCGKCKDLPDDLSCSNYILF